ncbi:hypothetical protein T11_5078 [Trichinella zimbabwensis]|uniref:Uncharacterized protein n=1 Tax=Trichinella zimbabwensis TaxID=268475 RepID=A0A0V1H8Z0_9BILA|nr:hypothetical protein T11_5078 [Trichinella zimbabwensis]
MVLISHQYLGVTQVLRESWHGQRLKRMLSPTAGHSPFRPSGTICLDDSRDERRPSSSVVRLSFYHGLSRFNRAVGLSPSDPAQRTINIGDKSSMSPSNSVGCRFLSSPSRIDPTLTVVHRTQNSGTDQQILRFAGSLRRGRDCVTLSDLGRRTMGCPIRTVLLAADATGHDPTIYETRQVRGKRYRTPVPVTKDRQAHRSQKV